MDITVRYVESGSSEGSIVGMEPPAGSKFAADGKVVLQVSSGSHPQSVNKYAEFVVPQGSGTQDVQIILIDANGQRTVYQGAQKAGVRIRQKWKLLAAAKCSSSVTIKWSRRKICEYRPGKNHQNL